MAKAVRNVQIGNTIDYTNGGSTAIEYREVVSLTTRIGIAAEKIAAGAVGSLKVTEVWELPAVTGVAFSVGDALYWNTTNGNLTKTNTDVPAGWCVEAKASAGTVAKVKIG
jgi:predicted RecA/RadA family phage recombinase